MHLLGLHKVHEFESPQSSRKVWGRKKRKKKKRGKKTKERTWEEALGGFARHILYTN